MRGEWEELLWEPGSVIACALPHSCRPFPPTASPDPVPRSLLLASKPALSFKNSNTVPSLRSPSGSLLVTLRPGNPTVWQPPPPFLLAVDFTVTPTNVEPGNDPQLCSSHPASCQSDLESASHICLLFSDHFWKDLFNCSSWLQFLLSNPLVGQIHIPEMHPDVTFFDSVLSHG